MVQKVGKKYMLFWCGWKEKTEGVGVFVAEKWVDQIDRYNEKIIVVKLVAGNRIMNVFSIYAPHLGKCDEEKEFPILGF